MTKARKDLLTSTSSTSASNSHEVNEASPEDEISSSLSEMKESSSKELSEESEGDETSKEGEKVFLGDEGANGSLVVLVVSVLIEVTATRAGEVPRRAEKEKKEFSGTTGRGEKISS